MVNFCQYFFTNFAKSGFLRVCTGCTAYAILVYTNKNQCRIARQETEDTMKQFTKFLALLVAFAAGAVALYLAMGRGQNDKYISVYDTDEDSMPF